MAKNKVSEWSATPANNTDIGGIDIAEGCAPSGINNAIREMMAQVKDMVAGTDGDNFTVGGNLAVTGTSTFTGAVTMTTDLPITEGGTGASTASGARTNLGLGTISTQNANNVAITGGTITGLSSALPVASGGTGVTTSTGTGSVVLSNSPTLVTPNLGTPSALVGTNITGTANSLNAGIGVNQTWQLPSRSTGTSYQNTTGKPIQVCYSFTASGNQRTVTGDVSTDNVTWITIIRAFNSNDDDVNGGNVSFIVPNNYYYRITSNGSSSAVWAELR